MSSQVSSTACRQKFRPTETRPATSLVALQEDQPFPIRSRRAVLPGAGRGGRRWHPVVLDRQPRRLRQAHLLNSWRRVPHSLWSEARGGRERRGGDQWFCGAPDVAGSDTTSSL